MKWDERFAFLSILAFYLGVPGIMLWATHSYKLQELLVRGYLMSRFDAQQVTFGQVVVLVVVLATAVSAYLLYSKSIKKETSIQSPVLESSSK